MTELPDLAALHRAVTPTMDEAAANQRAVFALQPSLPELRDASTSLMADRARAEFDTGLSATWRGRLALRLSRCTREGEQRDD